MTAQERFNKRKRVFLFWLKEEAPAIVDKGQAIVWRGYVTDEMCCRVRIDRYGWTDKHEPLFNTIDTESNIPEMESWMCKHQTFIKGLLMMYCKAVWDLLDNGLLNRADFDREEDDVDFGEDEGTPEYDTEDEAYSHRCRDCCESKYGWDYS